MWNYFQFHASQRLITFNFYIVISTAIAAGYIVTVGMNSIRMLAILLGFIISLLSFLFWKLDVRNKQMIKNAEEALKYLEALTYTPRNTKESNVLKIFTYEEEQTNRMKRSKSFWPWKNHYSYSKCFNIVFAVFGILGFFGVVYAIAISFTD
ncbi:hypothetical protein ES703_78699 [subsurface metagenome]